MYGEVVYNLWVFNEAGGMLMCVKSNCESNRVFTSAYAIRKVDVIHLSFVKYVCTHVHVATRLT
jgi:hypothetical protein